jgi:quercetin dioxygenase-like cupin family protein
MEIITLDQIPGDRFPTGRHTRVLIGVHSPIQAEHFVSGIVIIEPNGSIPIHEHEQEEVYHILKGTGEMTVGEETEIMKPVSAVYIPPNANHGLKNVGQEELHMLFVYSPAGVVSHWQEEREGKLK